MFSDILRQLRLEQKLTQSDMAAAIGISRVAYTNYELGNREPDFLIVTRIANILGVSVDYLLGNSTMRSTSLTDSTIQTAAELPMQLRRIMLSISNLSLESRADLQKYIELLKIKEMASGSRNISSAARRQRSDFDKNNNGNAAH